MSQHSSHNAHAFSHGHASHKKVSPWLIFGVELLLIGAITMLLALFQVLRVAQTPDASSLLALLYVVIAAVCLGLGLFWTLEETLHYVHVHSSHVESSGDDE